MGAGGVAGRLAAVGRRVVARFPQIDNGVWWTYVAGDLARTWRFSLSAPWVDPGRERG